MDDYFNSYREMISLRGLTAHTLNSYSTYIRAYLNYLDQVLHRSWDPTQLPTRKFDEYLPYVPSRQEVLTLISSMPEFLHQLRDVFISEQVLIFIFS